MAIPPTAVRFLETVDPQEIKDFRVTCSPALEDGEMIDPANWTILALAAAQALGLEIIEGDATYPDPALNIDQNAIDFWAWVDQAFAGDPDFEGGGTPVPIEVTFLTTNDPPRKIQGTVLITLVEK